MVLLIVDETEEKILCVGQNMFLNRFTMKTRSVFIYVPYLTTIKPLCLLIWVEKGTLISLNPAINLLLSLKDKLKTFLLSRRADNCLLPAAMLVAHTLENTIYMFLNLTHIITHQKTDSTNSNKCWNCFLS